MLESRSLTKLQQKHDDDLQRNIFRVQANRLDFLFSAGRASSLAPPARTHLHRSICLANRVQVSHLLATGDGFVAKNAPRNDTLRMAPGEAKMQKVVYGENDA
jgi:hypothetical protein